MLLPPHGRVTIPTGCAIIAPEVRHPMPSRREFLAQSLAVAGAVALGQPSLMQASPGRRSRRSQGCAHSVLLGTVSLPSGAPLAGARVTLVDAAGTLIGEVRSGPAGQYSLDIYQSGEFRLGASAPDRVFQQARLDLTDCGGEIDAPELILRSDDQPGRWTRIGDTSPEYLGATDSGTLMPDGRILYCHDTDDPVIFDPATGAKFIPRGSGSAQGCHATTVLLDGRVLFVGGQDGEDPGTFRRGVPWVKAYDPATDTWERWPDLNVPRWYPTITRLPDGRLLVTGGGMPPDAARTDTAEIYDPVTRRSTLTGRMLSPAEFGPSALLFDGRALRSWWPPQLWDPATGAWRATGPFVQPERGYPGHAPHSLVLLPDGRAAAVGMVRPGGADPAGLSMLERYDPATETWTLGATPATLRSFPEVLLLPDGRVLAAGGHKEIPEQPGHTNRWGYTALADLYDPATDRWRALAPMPLPREYHALTILAPDGRVIVTAGTGAPAESGEGTDNRIDVFEPPYLFRGPRPVITRLGTTELYHGEAFSIALSGTNLLTGVVLIGLNAVTHYVDGGAGRLVRLPFRVASDGLQVTVPDDPIRLPAAHYMLFLMVDDIPSVGRIVRVRPPPDAPPSTVVPSPSVTVGPPWPTAVPTAPTPAATEPPRRRVYLPWGMRGG